MPIIFGEQEVTIKELSVDFSFGTSGIAEGNLIDLGGGEYVQFGASVLGAFQSERVVAFTDFPSVTEITITLPPTADPPFPPVWPYTWNTSLLYGREHLGQNLVLFRGNTYTIRVTITQNGEAVDITGGSFKFTAKWEITDDDADAVLQKSSPSDGIVLTDPTDGVITVTLDSADTLSLPLHTVPLFYDIQYINTGGEIFSVLNGTLTVKPNVTDV